MSSQPPYFSGSDDDFADAPAYGFGRNRRFGAAAEPATPPEKPLPPHRRRKLAGRSAVLLLFVLALVTGSLAGLMLVYSVDLPQITDLERYRPSTTTDLYDRKGRPIGSFALERREVVGYNDFAPILREAVISIEDKDFESHWGINVLRIGGALMHDLRSHGRAQGASTLTMQLARNLFLSSERTAGRKLQEAYLAIQIERTFTKQQIFTLYGNQIYLGSGMYGFEAASQFYFGKHARDLNLQEAALLAGLPKGPVGYSPILNPEKSLRRRNLVLSEMESDHMVSHEQAEQARNAPLGLHITQPKGDVAPWFQEEIRKELDERFGSEQVHESGMRIDTTLDLDLQKVANQSVLDGLAAYERRHGWKGRLENVLNEGLTLDNFRHPDWAVEHQPGDYVHAMVTGVEGLSIKARIGIPGREHSEAVLTPEDWQWTGWQRPDAVVRPGDLIYVRLTAAMAGGARRVELEQDSGTQGALMAIDNTSGDVLAMVGGRDFAVSQFNRATQAARQTGSSFKPYVYTAAMENGAKPTDMVVDSPVSYGGWTPHNYENDYKGAMTLAAAFAESRNIPAVRLAAQVGIHKVIDLVHRFGVTSEIQPYLPVALGAAEISLAQQVASYSVFPNDGVRVTPRLIRKVSNADGIVLWENRPEIHEVISQQTARSMMVLLEGVMHFGTGAAAAQLNHPLGGKTGTTSNYTDAWFMGFSPSITCGVWVGYDSRESLGEKETGARAALPIWMNWMRAAIAATPHEAFPGENLPPATVTPVENSAPNTEATLPKPGPVPAAPKNPPAPGAKTPGTRPAATPSAPKPATQAATKPATTPAKAPTKPTQTAQPAAKPARAPVKTATP